MDTESCENTGFALCVVAEKYVDQIKQRLDEDFERLQLDGSPNQDCDTKSLEYFIQNSPDYRKATLYLVNSPTNENQNVMVCFVEPVDFKVIGLPVVSLQSLEFQQTEKKSCFLASPISLKPVDQGGRATRLRGIQDFIIARDQDGASQLKLEVDDDARLEVLASLLDSERAESSSVFLHGFNDPHRYPYRSIHLFCQPDSKALAKVILRKLALNSKHQKAELLEKLKSIEWSCIDWERAITELNTVTQGSVEQAQQAEDEEEIMNDGDWVLLKTTVKGSQDADRAIAALQSRFQHSSNQWKTLTYQHENRASSVQLSVVEGETRAAIFIIILPESMEGGSTVTDEEMSLDLHEAAMDDDVALLDWLMDNSAMTMNMLQQTDDEGFTVIQQACRVGSINVVRNLISQRYASDDTFRLLRHQTTESGETALHLAVRCGYPQILHEVLQAVDRSKRQELISLQDKHNQSVEDITGQIHKDYGLLAGAVIKYHRWISNKEFKTFFEEHDYSLFKIPLTEKMNSEMYDKAFLHSPNELGQVRFKNFDTMICLRYAEIDPGATKRNTKALNSGDKFNKESLLIDPNSLHGWSNRGSILIRQGHHTDRQLEVIAHRVLQLQVEQGKQHFLSVVDYAYSLAETNRSDATRAKCCEMFTKAFDQVQHLHDVIYLRSYCDYFHAKILIRRAQDTFSSDKPLGGTALKQVIENAIDCLIRVADNEVDEFMGDLWLWLAELQKASIWKRLPDENGKEQLNRLLGKFEREVGKDEMIKIDVAHCLHEAEILAGMFDYESKFLLRIGKLYLQMAHESNNQQEKEKCFKKTCELSRLHATADVPIFMAVTDYVPAIMGLWGMQCVSQQPKVASKIFADYRLLTGKDPNANFLGVWKHASTEFYGTAGDIGGMLESTIEPLKKIVKNQNGAHICGEWLARVMALLGHPVEEIVQVFQYSLQNSDTGNKTKLYEKLGRYYESISDTDKATENYQNAVFNRSENGGYYTPSISKKRLKELA